MRALDSSGRSLDLVRRAVIVGVGLLALASLWTGLVAGDYHKYILASVAFNAITVLSISMLAGTSGIWSLGHAAFIAAGAYASTNLAAAGYPIEVILPVVVCACGLIGYVLGMSAGRFSILYFGLLTLAVALTTVEIIGRLSNYTGGDMGMAVGPMKSWLLRSALTSDNAPQACVVLTTLVFLVSDLVIKGAPGNRWRAVKSQRIASTAIGMTPYRANANAFAFSAAIASVGGVAAALAMGSLDPMTFNLHSGIMLIVGAVVGGIGSFFGALVGALFIVGVPEIGRNFPDIASFVMGLSMVLVLILLPRGVGPSVSLVVARRLGLNQRAEKLASQAAPVSHAIAELARELMPACDQPLRIAGLNVSFGGLKVLKDIALDVPAGQTLGLIGPNGAGKTTLINVLSGFVAPSGCDALHIGDIDLRKATAPMRLGCGIGRTFQHGELFDDLTIREMLTVAVDGRTTPISTGRTQPSTAAVVDRVLDGLNLRHVANAYPEELPFGLRKVADIARTLAAGARFVALDEPFSGLDQAEIVELRAVLAGMKSAGVSILIIDHAVQEILDVADRIVVLNFGTVLATGTPREISTNVEVQKAYFGSASNRRGKRVRHA